jgi:hypothetical protein
MITSPCLMFDKPEGMTISATLYMSPARRTKSPAVVLTLVSPEFRLAEFTIARWSIQNFVTKPFLSALRNSIGSDHDHDDRSGKKWIKKLRNFTTT